MAELATLGAALTNTTQVDEIVSTNMNAGFAAVSLVIGLSGVFWILGSKHLARDTQRVLDAESAGRQSLT